MAAVEQVSADPAAYLRKTSDDPETVAGAYERYCKSMAMRLELASAGSGRPGADAAEHAAYLRTLLDLAAAASRRPEYTAAVTGAVQRSARRVVERLAGPPAGQGPGARLEGAVAGDKEVRGLVGELKGKGLIEEDLWKRYEERADEGTAGEGI